MERVKEPIEGKMAQEATDYCRPSRQPDWAEKRARLPWALKPASTVRKLGGGEADERTV